MLAAWCKAVVDGLDKTARPEFIGAEPPNTRNTKTMRRLVRAACRGEEGGDLSLPVDPEAVAACRRALPQAGHCP